MNRSIPPGFRSPFAFIHLPWVGPSIPARPRPTKDGWPYPMHDPTPAPEPEHLNQIPDGRDLGPENESPQLSSGLRFPYEFASLPWVGLSIPARPRPTKDGWPYPTQLGQHVVLSLPKTGGCDVIAALPVPATRHLKRIHLGQHAVLPLPCFAADHHASSSPAQALRPWPDASAA